MIKRKYVEIGDSISQYENDRGIVNAKYVHSDSAFGEGNPLIEALPPRLTDDETRLKYEVAIAGYNSAIVSRMGRNERLARINDIKHMRIVMPFSNELDNAFYQALVDANVDRELVCDDYEGLVIRVYDKDINTKMLRVDSASGTGPSFGLIGVSGSGKSSAIKLMLSRYPQVIRHVDENGCDFYQITYIFLNCLPNSNFSALYEAIGAEIDKALGNTEPFYEEQVRKARGGLGGKLNVVSKLVIRFGISAIILDEIQEIDFSASKENSFESLMILSNNTKVSIIAIGTEEARDKMYVKARTRRRFGKVIKSDEKCNDIAFFRYMLQRIFDYQYFYGRVELTDELLQAFFDATHGVISQLISLYIELHVDYFRKADTVAAKLRQKSGRSGDITLEEYKEAHKYIRFTAEYIKKTARKLYGQLTEMYDFEDNKDVISRIEDIDTRIALMREVELQKQKQDAEAKTIMSKSAEITERQAMLNNVTVNIQKCSDYTVKQIETAFGKVVRKNTDKNEVDLTKLVMSELQKPKRITGRKVRDIDLDSVIESAMDNSFNKNAGSED